MGWVLNSIAALWACSLIYDFLVELGSQSKLNLMNVFQFILNFGGAG